MLFYKNVVLMLVYDITDYKNEIFAGNHLTIMSEMNCVSIIFDPRMYL